MKIKTWMLAVMLAITATAHGATNDLTGLLQQGLFEEEANRNLDAAIANYQSLASAFDKDRQLAATAIFRLGECYRKLGKTNEAVLQYQRIVKEFGDQPTLVTLSRQNLAGLNSAPALANREASDTALFEAQSNAALLETQLTQVQSLNHDQLRYFVQQNFPDSVLTMRLQELDLAQEQLIKLKADYAPEHPKYQNAKALVDDLNSKIDAQVSAAIQSLRGKLSIAQSQLRLLQKRQQDLAETSGGGGSSGTSESATTDDEQIQIRNIQAMIQNSPDLINAPGSESETPLQVAATKGQLVVAKYLLDHGADVNRKAQNGGADPGGTPLYLAAGHGHKAMVELLLARGADVNGASGFSPLNQAVSKGFTGVVDVLLANKADVNAWGSNNGKVLHTAVLKGNTDFIQALIAHGADVNVTDSSSNTPLHLAANQNKLDAAKILLAAKADMEARNNEGNTPLHEAARSGSDKVVSLLLDSGASVEAANHNNTTPLFFAVANGRAEATRVLLAHKADPNCKSALPNGSFSYPVELAAGSKNSEILKLLLDAGAKPESSPNDPYRPLFIAIANNAVDAVQLLLQHGADPNHPGGNNALPPLHTVLIDGRDKRMAPLLLDKGADPSAKDREGFAPLFRTTDPEMGRLLIEHKAAVNARDKYGNTPLLRAANSTATNFLAFLVEAGAKTDLQETNGNTALHYAAYNGGPESVAILLEHKANPNVQNSQGFTPLDIAKAGQNGWMPDSMLAPKPAMNHPTSAENQAKIADLLIQAGGLANLPKRDRIEVRRASKSVATIPKDSQNWNHFSLLEIIASSYVMLSPNSDRSGLFSSGGMGPRRDLAYPDFKKITIYRRTENSAKQTAININLDDILTSGDCSRDQTLEWGDVIEIPEADHPLNEMWPGLPQQVEDSLTKCLSREVTIQINGASSTLKLAPHHRSVQEQDLACFMLRYVLENSNLIRVSSDLSRVKVTRHDPATKKTLEWTVDCTAPNEANLWLRDGDVIEVPEK
jgi:ankyrin repeat protein